VNCHRVCTVSGGPSRVGFHSSYGLHRAATDSVVHNPRRYTNLTGARQWPPSRGPADAGFGVKSANALLAQCKFSAITYSPSLGDAPLDYVDPFIPNPGNQALVRARQRAIEQ